MYEARDLQLGTRVALKTVSDQSAETLLRLKNEFRALADLHHPNLVSLGELFERDGLWFFSMELVEGVDFVTYVRTSHGSSRASVSFSEKTAGATDVTMGMTTVTTSIMPGFEPRAQAVFDEDRLRRGFAQLVQGLAAVHAAGKTHRDVKPTNILVTREGRVVLLDFGLVTVAVAGQRSLSIHTVGTAEYMAPEQASGQEATPAADWYGAGVVLYEALTGQLPLSGNPFEVMMRKQSEVPPAPSKIAARVPADLDALCTRLLAIDPRDRPDAAAVIAEIGQPAPAVPAARSPTTGTAHFVGRQNELALLQRAFDDCAEGSAITLLVEGECGVGKSALIREAALGFEDRGAVVLAGRCHEREVVPFKAVDGVIDALSRHVGHLPEVEAALVIPRNAGLLGEVFPVLRRIKAIAQARRPTAASPIDPQELRTRLFAAMREMLSRLADHHQVVLILDDLQWADADSLALLAELLRPPDPPRLLTFAIRRTGADTAPPPDNHWLPPSARVLALGPLPLEEATRLAAALLRQATGGAGANAAEIAAEAGGLPMFIGEIVHHVTATGRRMPLVSSSLADAISGRIEVLPPEARRVLELIAVAGVPIARDILASAADVTLGEIARMVSLLRIGHLVQTAVGESNRGHVAPFHDRVRDAAVRTLEPKALRARHLALATALEGHDTTDHELLALHWRGAGDPDRADEYTLRAAAEAENAFAFGHAAALYREVVERQSDPPWSLRAKLAAALANTGRSAEAAAEYIAAATDAPPAEALDFRRHAAEQFLRSGHIDDGLTVIESVLEAVGMSMPHTPRRSLVSLLYRRARLRLRSLHFSPREPSQIPQETLARLDTCAALGNHLGMVDTIRGADFNSRCLLMALRLGERRRLAMALAHEAIFCSLSGQHARPRIARLNQVARQIIEALDEPEHWFWYYASAGTAEYYLGGFRRAADQLAEADRIGRERCTGFAWELSTIRLFRLWATYYLGELPAIATRVPHLVAEALERGDLYAAANLQLSLTNAAWLIGGDVDGAERMRAAALRRWSRRAFHVQHWFDATARAQIGLYSGAPAAALDHFQEIWRPMARSLLLRVELVRLEAHHLRARCHLLLAGSKRGPEREALIRAAERDARKLRKEKVAWNQPLVDLLMAGVANRRGDAEGAVDHLRVAVAGLEAAEMRLFLDPVRYRLGQLVGGDEGKAQVAAATAALTKQGVAVPRRWVRMLVPGFD